MSISPKTTTFAANFALLFVLIYFKSTATAQEDPNNQICDFGFESAGNTYWDEGGSNTTFNFETADPYDGSTYLSANVSSVSGWSEFVENENCQPFDVHEGNTYEYSFAYRTPQATDDFWVRVVLFTDQGSDWLGSKYLEPTTTWKVAKFALIGDDSYSVESVRLFLRSADYIEIDNFQFIPNSTDCAGVLNGTARYDICDQCSGGTSGVTPCTLSSRTFDHEPLGFNTKNLGGYNLLDDPNIMHKWEETKASIYRYPGGTFGNSFNWHTGTTMDDTRPPSIDPPITPTTLAAHLPAETDIMYMANVRLPTPQALVNAGISQEWTTMTTSELLSPTVLDAKIQDLIACIQSFADAGHAIKYLELGNEFYFPDADDKSARGDHPGSDGLGDHYPYDDNPERYMDQMDTIALAIKTVYPELLISVIQYDAPYTDWDVVVNQYFETHPDIRNHVDAITMHWYDDLFSTDPQISDLQGAIDALYDPFRYMNNKVDNALQLKVPDMDLWITEGDIATTATNNTWIDGMNEAIVEAGYLGFKQVTVYTPHIFMDGGNLIFVEPDDLETTFRGLGANMVMASVKGMSSYDEFIVNNDFTTTSGGGTYPNVTAYHLEDGLGNDRFILFNASANTYNNVDLSAYNSTNDLHVLKRYSSTPWVDGLLPNDNLSQLVGNQLTLEPFSFTVVAKEEVFEMIRINYHDIHNASSDFPDRDVLYYDFGEKDLNTDHDYSELSIHNKSTSSAFASASALEFKNGAEFSIVNASSYNNQGTGVEQGFAIRFNPSLGIEYQDTLMVTYANGKKEVSIIVRGAGFVDNDNDGFGVTVDCNDNNDKIYPGALDNQCDGIDNDCDGWIDEDVVVTYLDVTNDTICTAGIVNLDVNESGEFSWYEEEILGTSLTTGLSYSTSISEIDTFYVQDDRVDDYDLGLSAVVGTAYGGSNDYTQWGRTMYLNVTTAFNWDAASIFTNDSDVDLLMTIDGTGGTFVVTEENIPYTGKNGTSHQFNPDVFIPAGTYTISLVGTVGRVFVQVSDKANAEIPGVLEFGGTDGGTHYGFFYDWEVSVPSTCFRTPAHAIIDPNHSDCVMTALPSNHEASGIQVYPNPTSGYVKFSEEGNYRVLGPVGNVIAEGLGDELDLSGLAKGAYVLQLDGEIFRLVKQ